MHVSAGIRLGCITLALALMAVGSGQAVVKVPIHSNTEQHVDVHELCESLAQACWDLDPQDLGMTPLNSTPLQGEIAGADWNEGTKLGFSLLGERFDVKVRVQGNVSARSSDSLDSSGPDQIPCADSPLCPDLIVDSFYMQQYTLIDVRNFTASHCAVSEGSTAAGVRTLLRFEFVSPNVGPGDLEVGDPDDHPEWFEWGSCHGHWHFREYADYRFWDVPGYAAWQVVRSAHPGVPPARLLEEYPELADHFVAGHKQGFCVIDFMSWGSPIAGPVKPGQFKDCHDRQGITTAWADRYARMLDGQWIDVTGLAPGPYVLEAEVNPERLFAETDYSNNAAAAMVSLA